MDKKAVFKTIGRGLLKGVLGATGQDVNAFDRDKGETSAEKAARLREEAYTKRRDELAKRMKASWGRPQAPSGHIPNVPIREKVPVVRGRAPLTDGTKEQTKATKEQTKAIQEHTKVSKEHVKETKKQSREQSSAGYNNNPNNPNSPAMRVGRKTITHLSVIGRDVRTIKYELSNISKSLVQLQAKMVAGGGSGSSVAGGILETLGLAAIATKAWAGIKAAGAALKGAVAVASNPITAGMAGAAAATVGTVMGAAAIGDKIEEATGLKEAYKEREATEEFQELRKTQEDAAGRAKRRWGGDRAKAIEERQTAKRVSPETPSLPVIPNDTPPVAATVAPIVKETQEAKSDKAKERKEKMLGKDKQAPTIINNNTSTNVAPTDTRSPTERAMMMPGVGIGGVMAGSGPINSPGGGAFTARDSTETADRVSGSVRARGNAIGGGDSTPTPSGSAISPSSHILENKTKVGRSGPSESVSNAMERAASDLGVDPRIIWGKASVESGYQSGAKAGISSATGLGQFLTGTWKEVAGYPDAAKYGITGDPNERFDPYKSAVASYLYSKKNIDGLKKEGLVTDEQLKANPGLYYVPHNLGPAGARRFLKGMRDNPDAPVSQFLTPTEIKNNPSIYAPNGRVLTAKEALGNIESGRFGDGVRRRQALAESGALPAVTNGAIGEPVPGQTLPQTPSRVRTNGRGATMSNEGLGPISDGVAPEVKQNQLRSGAIRNQPVDNHVQSALHHIAKQHGVGVEITSGGQPGIGTGGRRTGSTRHDHGGAADVKFTITENGQKRYLDMSNPADIPRFMAITSTARQAGMTGIGAGYMGRHTMHIGKGSETTWGGAPWLKQAFDHGKTLPPINPTAIARDTEGQVTQASPESKFGQGSGNPFIRGGREQVDHPSPAKPWKDQQPDWAAGKMVAMPGTVDLLGKKPVQAGMMPSIELPKASPEDSGDRESAVKSIGSKWRRNVTKGKAADTDAAFAAGDSPPPPPPTYTTGGSLDDPGHTYKTGGTDLTEAKRLGWGRKKSFVPTPPPRPNFAETDEAFASSDPRPSVDTDAAFASGDSVPRQSVSMPAVRDAWAAQRSKFVRGRGIDTNAAFAAGDSVAPKQSPFGSLAPMPAPVPAPSPFGSLPAMSSVTPPIGMNDFAAGAIRQIEEAASRVEQAAKVVGENNQRPHIKDQPSAPGPAHEQRVSSPSSVKEAEADSKGLLYANPGSAYVMPPTPQI